MKMLIEKLTQKIASLNGQKNDGKSPSNLHRQIFNKERITILTDVLDCLTPPHETECELPMKVVCKTCGECNGELVPDTQPIASKEPVEQTVPHPGDHVPVSCNDGGKCCMCKPCCKSCPFAPDGKLSTPTKTECEPQKYCCMDCIIARQKTKPTPPDKDLVTIEKIAGRKVTEYAISVEGVEMFSFNKEELLALQSKLNDLFPAKLAVAEKRIEDMRGTLLILTRLKPDYFPGNNNEENYMMAFRRMKQIVEKELDDLKAINKGEHD
jgi:hypothetical protein